MYIVYPLRIFIEIHFKADRSYPGIQEIHMYINKCLTISMIVTLYEIQFLT